MVPKDNFFAVLAIQLLEAKCSITVSVIHLNCFETMLSHKLLKERGKDSIWRETNWQEKIMKEKKAIKLAMKYHSKTEHHSKAAPNEMSAYAPNKKCSQWVCAMCVFNILVSTVICTDDLEYNAGFFGGQLFHPLNACALSDFLVHVPAFNTSLS